MQTTTCGVLVTDGKNLLICHPTNGRSWDIPKGRRDEGETDVNAAVRELSEETGLHVTADELEHLGVYEYKKSKRLSLFRHHVNIMPDPNKCHCDSHFEWHGRMIPEMDGFEVVSIPDAIGLVNQDMARVLSDIKL
jgi:putative (di)nucleoside polyphosphate hydrolase